MKTIDINCDVGEGIGNEEQLMPYLSSCNVACTGHAGTVKTIDETIFLAKRNNVKIGAHPSFPDKENFGRKIIEMPSGKLQKSIEQQIGILKKRIELQDMDLSHIKAHGALYNAAAKDEKIAKTFVNAVENSVEKAVLYVPFNSVIAQMALDRKISIKYEAFIDRNYNDDLSLVSREKENAIIIDNVAAFEHLIRMFLNKIINLRFICLAFNISLNFM